MRWRVAALAALLALAMAPAASDAAQTGHAPRLRVTVTPRTGSPTTRFVVSFTTAHATGRLGSTNRVYRIDAGDRGRSGCRSTVSAAVAPARAGTRIRVVLAPKRSQTWCPGTFRGQVWDVVTQRCPVTRACPAILPLVRLVGRFTFRVARG